MIYEVTTAGWLAPGWYIAGREHHGPYDTRQEAEAMNQERFTYDPLPDGDVRFADHQKGVTVDCPSLAIAERLATRTLEREARAAATPTKGVRDARLSRLFGLRF